MTAQPEHPERPAAPQTREIIGRKRQEELQAIRGAIEGTGTRVLHFVGPGGIGKTRQIREVARWHAAQVEGHPIIRQPYEWLGLVDLYHSDLHTPSVIERQIIGRIDPDFDTNPEDSPFRYYLKQREEFDERRRQGLTSEKERAELTQTFVSDYNDWVADRRAAIAFDTLELMVYEKDAVLSACEGESGSADVKGWLLEVLPLLDNTVVLLANRPHLQLEAEFESCFASTRVPYQRFDLVRLSEDDTLAYLEDIVAQRPDIGEAFEEPGRKPTDIYGEIWRYTEGVPILISLVIDLAAFGNVAALQRLRGVQDPENGTKVKKLLVDELKEITPPIWETLRCLAVARKGLTPGLLERLMADKGWSLDQCGGELGRLKDATFAKPRVGTEALFLHDALYEMFDALKPFPLLDPGRLLPVIINYYEEQIRACAADMGACRVELRKLDLRERAGLVPPGHEEQRRALQERLAGREREWQRLQVEVVYYKLWYDPREGFEHYARLDDAALKAHEFGFDARLHDEILRYVNSPQYNDAARRRLPRDEFDRHCSLRWVKRHLARGDREGNERTARVAGRILGATEPPLGGANAQADLLYQAEARLWGAEALLLLGREQGAEKWLNEALGLLKRTRARRSYRQWRRNRLIGRVHNDLGYMVWKSGRYRKGVKEFQAALPYFHKADILDERADTLNNLAYVYSVLGETERAKSLVEGARQLREELGQEYPLALSYNTSGEIHTVANEPEEAVAWCERARAIFSAMEDARGLGLAYIGLGRAHRKTGDKGKRGEYPFKQSQGAFGQAVEWLVKALNIFGGDEPPVREPYRLWETLNELGSTYVDWAYLLVWYGLRDQADEKYRLAVQYQERAARVAEQAGFALQMLDSYDDLAQAHADWGEPAQAQEYLRKISRAVPEEYRLVEGIGFRKLPDPVDGYWLVLGKYYLQRGIWTYNQADQSTTPQEKDRFLDEAAHHFALAMAYFQKFSPDLAHVNLTSRAMYRRFRTLKLERLEHLRREVQDVARKYRVNLSRLLDTMDDALGHPTRSL